MSLMPRFDIPAPVLKAIALLEGAGFEAWAVGGCVRDTFLGKTPPDWDLTTSAAPDEMKRVFAGKRVIETGIAHGTVTVIIDGQSLEITTYRVDGDYADHRHPDKVTFTRSIGEDLARRDFTVNAMAYHPLRGLLDPYGGREDLGKKRLRCVGDPDRRFREDALRILRGLRFAAQCELWIDPETERAMRELRELTVSLAAERVLPELTKLLTGPAAVRVLREQKEVLHPWLPFIGPMTGFEQHNPHHVYDVWEHTLHAIDAAPREPTLRWAALLHDSGKPRCYSEDEKGVGHFYRHAQASEAIAAETLKKLKADSGLFSRVTNLVRTHDIPLEASEKCLLRALNRWGEQGARDWIAIHRADNAAQSPDLAAERLKNADAAEAILNRLIQSRACFSLRDLAVSGRDLIAAGFKPSPEMGRMLDTLLSMVMNGEAENERETLLALAPELDETRKKE